MKAVIPPSANQNNHTETLWRTWSQRRLFTNVNRPQSEPTSRLTLQVWGEITFHKDEGTFKSQRCVQVRNQPWNERKLSMLLPPQTRKLNVLVWGHSDVFWFTWTFLREEKSLKFHLLTDVDQRKRPPSMKTRQLRLLSKQTIYELKETPINMWMKPNTVFSSTRTHTHTHK